MLQLPARLLIQLVLCLAIPNVLFAQSASQPSGQVVEIEVPAPSLAGNLLEIPDTQNAAVYLPPSYDNEPDRRYPAVFSFMGYSMTTMSGFKM